MKTLSEPFSQIRDHCLCPGDQGLLGLDGFVSHSRAPVYVTAQMETYPAVGKQGIPQSHITQQTLQRRGENPKKVAASAQMRSSRELNLRQGLYSFPSGRAELSKVELCKVGVGGVSSPELEVNSGIGEIRSPKPGLFNPARQLECSMSETW